MTKADEGYYGAVAERILPFLRGRKVAVEQRFRGSNRPVYRRHEGSGDDRRWIAIRTPNDLYRWVRQRAVAFHAHLKPNGPGCWFALDIDSRELPVETARLAAWHALDIIEESGLGVLVKFSGSDGFHLMWEMPDLRGLGGGRLWDLQRNLVDALAVQVERRLADDRRADPVRAAVGSGNRLITTSSQDETNKAALLFDKHILKPNVNFRVPYSLHAESGLVSVPLDRAGLERFDESMAKPTAVVGQSWAAEMPQNSVADVKQALRTWYD